jgi:hypothetical protein
LILRIPLVIVVERPSTSTEALAGVTMTSTSVISLSGAGAADGVVMGGVADCAE